ncbi:hypothetical protein, partial [Aeromonas veronii]|uniref:hypothetical protein n=1 Tax=Aeromonas veronii TaxID=654 RepID=UPI003D1C6C5C
LEYRPVTPGVAGSSPVRSATNLKAFPIGKAFLLWVVLLSDTKIFTGLPTILTGLLLAKLCSWWRLGLYLAYNSGM